MRSVTATADLSSRYGGRSSHARPQPSGRRRMSRPAIIGTVQLFNEPTVLAVRNGWMGPGYTPMMMAYNTMMGTLSPQGAGPASAVALMMAVVAGSLAVVYALVQRRVTR